jgi:hypothetical protein
VTLVKFRLPVFVNWGAYKVQCPRCPSADLAPAQVFLCTECGTRAEVEWPPEELRYGIERLLLMRPDVTTQNWEPGETLTELMWENGAHGIFTELPEGHSDLIVEDGRIRMDTLPVTFRRELKAIA